MECGHPSSPFPFPRTHPGIFYPLDHRVRVLGPTGFSGAYLSTEDEKRSLV